MIGTKGDFQINPRWSFGWDLLYQSDKNFSRTYGIDGYSDVVQRSEIYLTGLNDRNLFDLHAYHFNVQEALPDSKPAFARSRPAVGAAQLRLHLHARRADRWRRTEHRRQRPGHLSLRTGLHDVRRAQSLHGSHAFPAPRAHPAASPHRPNGSAPSSRAAAW